MGIYSYTEVQTAGVSKFVTNIAVRNPTSGLFLKAQNEHAAVGYFMECVIYFTIYTFHLHCIMGCMALGTKV